MLALSDSFPPPHLFDNVALSIQMASPSDHIVELSLLLFMFHSAMRRNEVAHLLWSDLTFHKRGVVVVSRRSKTDQESKSQTIALPRLDHAYPLETGIKFAPLTG